MQKLERDGRWLMERGNLTEAVRSLEDVCQKNDGNSWRIQKLSATPRVYEVEVIVDNGRSRGRGTGPSPWDAAGRALVSLSEAKP